jgi:hypothetical protein
MQNVTFTESWNFYFQVNKLFFPFKCKMSKNVPLLFLIIYVLSWEHVLELMAEAPQAGRSRVWFPLVSLKFFLVVMAPESTDPRKMSISNIFCEVKAVGALGWKSCHHHVRISGNLRSQTSRAFGLAQEFLGWLIIWNIDFIFLPWRNNL